MKNPPLISIIIPTFNRAHLIGETLDSILSQTYQNWECIIVDDGSTDLTHQIVNEYINRDSRFQYHHRPKNKPKGGNAARNYGFSLSKGDYINWFDSDDIMFKDLLIKKIDMFKINEDIDFVISKSIDFNPIHSTQIMTRHYTFDPANALNADNFVLNKVYWITMDAMFKRNMITVLFDEEIKSGQEYNFFVRLLATQNKKGLLIDEGLCLRRIHDNSIQQSLKKDELKAVVDKYVVMIKTYMTTSKFLKRSTNLLVVNTLITLAFRQSVAKTPPVYFKQLLNLLFKEKGVLKGIAFLSSLFMAYFFKRGYKLMDFSRL